MPTESKVEEVFRHLTREQTRQLSEIENTRRWAWDARQDAAHARQMTAARYFVLGATGYDFEDSDDETLRAIMAKAYDE
jgi:hypothetical protein